MHCWQLDKDFGVLADRGTEGLLFRLREACPKLQPHRQILR
jgi:hypothetical protein